MNQIGAGSLVQQADNLFQQSGGFLFVGAGLQGSLILLDSGAETGTSGSVLNAASLSDQHSFLRGFEVCHVFTSSKTNVILKL